MRRANCLAPALGTALFAFKAVAASAGSLNARAQALAPIVAVFKLGNAVHESTGGPAGTLRLP